MSDQLIILLCVLVYFMLGIFSMTLVNKILDGPDDVDGAMIFLTIFWPVTIGLLILCGLLVAPYYLAEFIVEKLDRR